MEQFMKMSKKLEGLLECEFNLQRPEICPYTKQYNLVDCRYVTPKGGCKYTPVVHISLNYELENGKIRD